MTDEEIDIVLGGAAFDSLSVKLFHHVIRCAHPGPLKQWIINLDWPCDEPEVQKAFVGAVFRAVLTPTEDHQRDGEINHAIKDTTTGPLDEGGGT